MKCSPIGYLGVVALAALMATGCSYTPASSKDGKDDHAGHAEADHDDHAGHDHAGHSHDGWWCGEHGVPEEVCALCSPKLAAEFQKKGDWCQKHNRPDSQCFVCHPELEAKFVAQYEAKFGEKPPKPK